MSAITSTGWWNAPIRFLPCGELMPVLPPTGGIDLRQQRGRHLHEIDAAAQDRRREAGEIADHAAAERDDQVVALDLGRDQRLAHLRQAWRSSSSSSPSSTMIREVGDARRGERRLGRLQPMLGNGAVGDDGGAHAGPQRRDALTQRAQHVAADHDVIGAVAERDVDGNGGGVFQGRSHGEVAFIPSAGGSTAGRAPHRCACRASEAFVDDAVVRHVARRRSSGRRLRRPARAR